MITPSEIARRLSERVQDVCAHLLPGGKRKGSEWVCGDTDGDTGTSLGVCLKGEKAGIWSDFAKGDAGDLLDLWCAARRVDMKTAMREAKDYLGVSDPRIEPAATKTYVRPAKPRCAAPKLESPVFDYLKGRGLSEETVKAFKIAEQGRNILFPFLRDGILIHWKTLGIDRPDGKKKIMAAPGSEPCLFGWQAIPEDAREVTITEGEIDAMTAWQYGKPALSVPMGGGTGAKQNWIEHEFQNLERFDVIYLCLDDDAPGQEATDEIIKRLGRERCRVVKLGCKDFNTALALYYDQDDVDQAYIKAKSLDPERLQSVDSFRAQVLGEFFDKNPALSGMETPWNKANDIIRFRNSEVTVWTGWSGHGKSQVLGYLAFHGIRKQSKFCIASMEMPAKRTLQRMVRQAGGLGAPSAEYINAILDGMAGKLWMYDQVGSARLPEMLETFRYAARRYGVNQFIVDSLAKLGIREDDYNGQKDAVESLVAFAHEMDVHVHLVCHPRKSDDESKVPGKLDVRGGAAITDLVDNVIAVWRNKRKEAAAAKLDLDDVDTSPDVHLVVDKQRLTGVEGKIYLWFEPVSAQYMEYSGQKAKQWINYSKPEVIA